MDFQEYPIFQTLNDAKMYCQQHSRLENRCLLLSYFQRESLFTKYQIWAAPSLYYLQYMLNLLYDLDEAYSRYDSLSPLEKHGVAHLIASLSAPYVEGQPEIVLAIPESVPVEYIIYISTKEYSKGKQTCRRIRKFEPSTCEAKTKDLPVSLKLTELKQKLQSFFGCGSDICIYENNYISFDHNDVNYFGNYIHEKIKDIMGYRDAWGQIQILRNRLAHPHEGLSEKDLKNACNILCKQDFISDLEALVFLLSPLTLDDIQSFCDSGYHNNKNVTIRLAHGVLRKR